MSIVSPLHTKLTIKMPSRFNNSNRDQRPMKNLNEYTLFLMLEKQRNKKLRDLYQGGSLKTSKDEDMSKEGVALPKFPPRYQCLNLSASWFVSEANKLRRELFVHNSTREQWKTGLDQVTKTFLEDLANVLKEQYGGEATIPQTACSAPPCIPSLSPTAITPPSSPLTLPPAASEDSLLPGNSCEAGGKEVDISDSEIMSIWDCAVPSEDGIDFDI